LLQRVTMEDLFASTTRFRDFYRATRERDDDDEDDEDEERIDGVVELELITGSSAEDTFLHSGFKSGLTFTRLVAESSCG
jgi:hypothetical protein